MMSAQNRPATANPSQIIIDTGIRDASGSMPPANWTFGQPGTGKSAFLTAAFSQASNPADWNRYSINISDSFLDLYRDLLLDLFPVAPDFSRATAAVATGTSWSDFDFRQRLAEQLERDAEDIRKSCAIVRDPSKPREITCAGPDEMMAITRLVCGG